MRTFSLGVSTSRLNLGSEPHADENLLDDPDLMHGAPVNLQLVAQRLHDEQLLHDVEMIDRVLKA